MANDWRNARIEEAWWAALEAGDLPRPRGDGTQRQLFEAGYLAALAVFEKALGEATDASTCEHCGGTSWHHTVECFTGEPSDTQRLWAVISEAQARFRKYASQEAPTYDEEVDALLDISRILSGASGPQEDDAQVEAAAREINLIFYRADTRELGAEGWDRLYREMAAAALRAAFSLREGEVR